MLHRKPQRRMHRWRLYGKLGIVIVLRGIILENDNNLLQCKTAKSAVNLIMKRCNSTDCQCFDLRKSTPYQFDLLKKILV